MVALAGLVLVACKINTDVNQVVAVEIVLPDSGRVELPDTFLPTGRALNGLGDSVGGQQLYWTSLDTAIIAVLDSTTGVTLPKKPGVGRLQARVGNLFSNPQNVTVLARLDSMNALSAARDTIDLTPDSLGKVDSLSSPLQIAVFSIDGVPSGRRVVFTATTFPASDSLVTFLPNDSVLTTATSTSAVGQTQLVVRPHAGTPPDSVVVSATMKRLDGTPIPGSPQTFVVEIKP